MKFLTNYSIDKLDQGSSNIIIPATLQKPFLLFCYEMEPSEIHRVPLTDIGPSRALSIEAISCTGPSKGAIFFVHGIVKIVFKAPYDFLQGFLKNNSFLILIFD